LQKITVKNEERIAIIIIRKELAMSLKEDMKLDVQNLDRAALDQPTIYAEWGEAWAKAVLERDKMIEKITATKAELLKSVREDPGKYGWKEDKKPGENWFASIVEFHPSIMKLKEKLPELEYEVNMMRVAKDDCEQRQRSLNLLVELYKGNYFSASSKGTASYRTAVENSQDKQREKLNDSPRLKKLTKKV
jgi:hypothetical protein